MRASEFLSELFSPGKSANLSWPSDTHAVSKLPGNRRLMINFISHGDGVFAIEFNVDDQFDMTGKGDVSSVFSTVIAAIKQFVQHQGSDLKSLFFTADEQSRAKMYDTLAKRVAKQVGWHVIPYDEMVTDEKYKTPLSYGDFLFALEPGNAPEHRATAQKPQHAEFLPVFYVVSMEDHTLPAYKIKAKNGNDAERWIMKNIPEYKNLDAFGVIARRTPPNDRPIIDKGTMPEKPKPIPQDPNSLGAKLRAKLDAPQNENFADGKNPQDKGDSARHGIPKHASISTLRKIAKQGGRKGQLAHWQANMRSGKAK